MLSHVLHSFITILLSLQAVMECVVNPPKEGEPSYEQFQAEKKGVLSSLAMRAEMVVEAFNSVPGMSCNIVQGAMYAFPQVCNAFLTN